MPPQEVWAGVVSWEGRRQSSTQLQTSTAIREGKSERQLALQGRIAIKGLHLKHDENIARFPCSDSVDM